MCADISIITRTYHDEMRYICHAIDPHSQDLSAMDSAHDDGFALEMAELPLETRCPPFALRQYSGFWLPEAVLARGLPAARDRFAPRPDDVLLASFPKSGTTWLKALAYATVHRAAHPPSADDHPLGRRSPHDCVPFLEISLARADDVGAAAAELEALPSPRVLATHLPFSLLPERIRSRSRIVYVCRNPKDALVSSWLFTRKASEAVGVDAESFPLQDAVELYCAGRCFGGPQWRHVVEYWEASLNGRNEHPDRVLFLRYEEMLRDPVGSLRTMAEFMGCAFSPGEEERGVPQAIVELCSLEKLKNVEASRGGGRTVDGIKADAYFRKGVAGDWSSHMTPEMGKMVDEAVEDGLRGSGFSFADTNFAQMKTARS
ncbi:cytosolic sulfotransferase 7-like [Triticum dicoccoides]|uniref:cytosolic sulfotransferase 7-like n=1 Tax=Triticum dicoccoides TaxID=85692 RepID=UPI00188F2748|nr:cytosolic sulfotransferase 7-like [Triticum dicoccoides]